MENHFEKSFKFFSEKTNVPMVYSHLYTWNESTIISNLDLILPWIDKNKEVDCTLFCEFVKKYKEHIEKFEIYNSKDWQALINSCKFGFFG